MNRHVSLTRSQTRSRARSRRRSSNTNSCSVQSPSSEKTSKKALRKRFEQLFESRPNSEDEKSDIVKVIRTSQSITAEQTVPLSTEMIKEVTPEGSQSTTVLTKDSFRFKTKSMIKKNERIRESRMMDGSSSMTRQRKNHGSKRGITEMTLRMKTDTHAENGRRCRRSDRRMISQKKKKNDLIDSSINSRNISRLNFSLKKNKNSKKDDWMGYSHVCRGSSSSKTKSKNKNNNNNNNNNSRIGIRTSVNVRPTMKPTIKSSNSTLIPRLIHDDCSQQSNHFNPSHSKSSLCASSIRHCRMMMSLSSDLSKAVTSMPRPPDISAESRMSCVDLDPFGQCSPIIEEDELLDLTMEEEDSNDDHHHCDGSLLDLDHNDDTSGEKDVRHHHHCSHLKWISPRLRKESGMSNNKGNDSYLSITAHNLHDSLRDLFGPDFDELVLDGTVSSSETTTATTITSIDEADDSELTQCFPLLFASDGRINANNNRNQRCSMINPPVQLSNDNPSATVSAAIPATAVANAAASDVPGIPPPLRKRVLDTSLPPPPALVPTIPGRPAGFLVSQSHQLRGAKDAALLGSQNHSRVAQHSKSVSRSSIPKKNPELPPPPLPHPPEVFALSSRPVLPPFGLTAQPRFVSFNPGLRKPRTILDLRLRGDEAHRRLSNLPQPSASSSTVPPPPPPLAGPHLIPISVPGFRHAGSAPIGRPPSTLIAPGMVLPSPLAIRHHNHAAGGPGFPQRTFPDIDQVLKGASKKPNSGSQSASRLTIPPPPLKIVDPREVDMVHSSTNTIRKVADKVVIDPSVLEKAEMKQPSFISSLISGNNSNNGMNPSNNTLKHLPKIPDFGMCLPVNTPDLRGLPEIPIRRMSMADSLIETAEKERAAADHSSVVLPTIVNHAVSNATDADSVRDEGVDPPASNSEFGHFGDFDMKDANEPVVIPMNKDGSMLRDDSVMQDCKVGGNEENSDILEDGCDTSKKEETTTKVVKGRGRRKSGEGRKKRKGCEKRGKSNRSRKRKRSKSRDHSDESKHNPNEKKKRKKSSKEEDKKHLEDSAVESVSVVIAESSPVVESAVVAAVTVVSPPKEKSECEEKEKTQVEEPKVEDNLSPKMDEDDIDQGSEQSANEDSASANHAIIEQSSSDEVCCHSPKKEKKRRQSTRLKKLAADISGNDSVADLVDGQKLVYDSDGREMYEQEWEVQCVVAHRQREVPKNNRKRAKKIVITEYLVKWKGWDHSSNTWQREEDLQCCQELLHQYLDSLSDDHHNEEVNENNNDDGNDDGIGSEECECEEKNDDNNNEDDHTRNEMKHNEEEKEKEKEEIDLTAEQQSDVDDDPCDDDGEISEEDSHRRESKKRRQKQMEEDSDNDHFGNDENSQSLTVISEESNSSSLNPTNISDDNHNEDQSEQQNPLPKNRKRKRSELHQSDDPTISDSSSSSAVQECSQTSDTQKKRKLRERRRSTAKKRTVSRLSDSDSQKPTVLNRAKSRREKRVRHRRVMSLLPDLPPQVLFDVMKGIVEDSEHELRESAEEVIDYICSQIDC